MRHMHEELQALHIAEALQLAYAEVDAYATWYIVHCIYYMTNMICEPCVHMHAYGGHQ